MRRGLGGLAEPKPFPPGHDLAPRGTYFLGDLGDLSSGKTQTPYAQAYSRFSALSTRTAAAQTACRLALLKLYCLHF